MADDVSFGEIDPKRGVVNVRKISTLSIRACPHLILVPDHYREDGSCRCNDRENVVMLEWGYAWNEDAGQWE